jgi:hypothetical protein
MAVFWTAILVVAGPRLSRLWRLSRSAQATQGIVTSVDRLDHNRATYRYSVAGRTYTNSEVGSARSSGDVVTVYYLPNDPSVAALAVPHAAFHEGLVGTVILCALVAVWQPRALSPGPAHPVG